MAKFPMGAVDSGQYLPGQPVELSVEFDMYPTPLEEDLKWIIKELDIPESEAVHVPIGKWLY